MAQNLKVDINRALSWISLANIQILSRTWFGLAWKATLIILTYKLYNFFDHMTRTALTRFHYKTIEKIPV